LDFFDFLGFEENDRQSLTWRNIKEEGEEYLVRSTREKIGSTRRGGRKGKAV